MTEYHALTRSERDHLLAAAQFGDERPSGQDIQARVEQLRGGERPANTTTYTVLDTLVDAGLLSRFEVNGKTQGYRVTDAGRDVLVSARENLHLATRVVG